MNTIHSSLSFPCQLTYVRPGRAKKIKSLTLVLEQHSTVPVAALHHHADLQARKHYTGVQTFASRLDTSSPAQLGGGDHQPGPGLA